MVSGAALVGRLAVTLVSGTNRLLVKVDQGSGSWSMSCRPVARSAEQAAMAALSTVGLAVVPTRAVLPASEPISFSVRTDPALGLSIPVVAVLREEEGKEVASVRAATGEALVLPNPDAASGLIEIAATAHPSAVGEAEEISGGRAATLEFLADRLEGMLHPALEGIGREVLAAGFATDVLREIAESRHRPLPGYRQYAYRSRIDGSLQPYCLYLPAGFDPQGSYGLIVALHGYTGDDWSGGLGLAGLDTESDRTVLIDGVRVPIPAGASGVSLYRDPASGWGVDPSPPDPRRARHDGGGIADLFVRPLLIVYGTQDPDRSPPLERAARRLADWPTQSDIPIGVKTGRFLVAADADGEVSVAGRAYPGHGLALTVVNPRAPSQLLGYIDAPDEVLDDPSTTERWFRFFVSRFINNRLDETATWPGFSPDVMVLTRDPFRDAWSGWWDRNWENLTGR